MKLFKHFITITRHRHMVMRYCFRLRLFRQGLAHDLSKYSPVEFFNGVKYYLGTKSPHHAERDEKGYSDAWMHHKGRNKHHIEYWTDVIPGTHSYVPVKMPRKYVAEMFCDRLAASKNYNRKHFESSYPYDYFIKEHLNMHEETYHDILMLLEMYRDKGEKETFRYIRRIYLKNK